MAPAARVAAVACRDRADRMIGPGASARSAAPRCFGAVSARRGRQANPWRRLPGVSRV